MVRIELRLYGCTPEFRDQAANTMIAWLAKDGDMLIITTETGTWEYVLRVTSNVDATFRPAAEQDPSDPGRGAGSGGGERWEAVRGSLRPLSDSPIGECRTGPQSVAPDERIPTPSAGEQTRPALDGEQDGAEEAGLSSSWHSTPEAVLITAILAASRADPSVISYLTARFNRWARSKGAMVIERR